MKKILFLSVLLLLYFIPAMSNAQFISALENIAGKGCTLERPKEFIIIQDSILSKELPPGIQADIISQKISQAKKDILKAIDDIQVELEKNNIIIKYNSTFSQEIPLIKFGDTCKINFDTLRKAIVDSTSEFFRDLPFSKDQLHFSKTEQELFVYALKAINYAKGISKNNLDFTSLKLFDGSEASKSKDQFEDIYKEIGILLANKIIYLLPPQAKLCDDSLQPEIINKRLKAISSAYKEEISSILDMVEAEIVAFVSKTNKVLINANLSFGMTQQTDNVSPGFIVQKHSSKPLRISFFVTGNFSELMKKEDPVVKNDRQKASVYIKDAVNTDNENEEEDYSNSGFLTGLRLQHKFLDYFELELLASYQFINDFITKKDQYEAGFGLNIHLKCIEIIATPVGYMQGEWNSNSWYDEKNPWMAGIRITKDTPQAISLFFGASGINNQKGNFIFQTGIPLNLIGI